MNCSNRQAITSITEVNGESDVTDANEQKKVPSLAGLMASLADGRGIGFMARSTREALLKRMSTDPTVRDRIRDDVEAMRVNMLGSAPTTLEEILVDRVVVAWLQAQFADHTYGNRGDMTLPQLESTQRWQDRSHRRLLQACKALAQVRKMEIHLQVNIGEKQINVVGGGS
jgi:hypothetical protein